MVRSIDHRAATQTFVELDDSQELVELGLGESVLRREVSTGVRGKDTSPA